MAVGQFRMNENGNAYPASKILSAISVKTHNAQFHIFYGRCLLTDSQWNLHSWLVSSWFWTCCRYVDTPCFPEFSESQIYILISTQIFFRWKFSNKSCIWNEIEETTGSHKSCWFWICLCWARERERETDSEIDRERENSSTCGTTLAWFRCLDDNLSPIVNHKKISGILQPYCCFVAIESIFHSLTLRLILPVGFCVLLLLCFVINY